MFLNIIVSIGCAVELVQTMQPEVQTHFTELAATLAGKVREI